MSDTPRVYCPSCEPEADQIAEMLETQHCGAHTPARTGADDALARCDALFPSMTESESYRAFCREIHGDHAEVE